jgi:hypothetical protein
LKSAKGWTRDDWMSMTMSDWIEATPSDWMDRTLPGWRDRSYGDLLRAKPSDWLSMMYGSLAPGIASTQSAAAHRHRHGDCGCGCHDSDPHHHGHHGHHHGDDCGHCGPDPCQCFCCLGDVDLAVYARVGEIRVVPIVVENERRREKAVTLELSGWTTRGGNPGQAETMLLEPKAFTLAPCGQQQVTLVVRVRPQAGGTPAPTPAPNRTPAETVDTAATGERHAPADVDSCQVVSADLRILGCDHRPIRVAVAILPRDCDPYRVSCGCSCC